LERGVALVQEKLKDQGLEMKTQSDFFQKRFKLHITPGVPTALKRDIDQIQVMYKIIEKKHVTHRATWFISFIRRPD
jgi:hypothetical protein